MIIHDDLERIKKEVVMDYFSIRLEELENHKKTSVKILGPHAKNKTQDLLSITQEY
jgi:hypothetical protein